MERLKLDKTYIHTIKHGWCYLATIMDLHTRKIIGYSFSKNMTTKLTIDALEKAYFNAKPKGKTIVHSDRGTQYTSQEYVNILKNFGLTPSYSNKGNPYDNACIESFHSILKKEEVNHKKYRDYNEARIALFEYIESWYNRKRIHGSIGYMTPQEYEDSLHIAS